MIDRLSPRERYMLLLGGVAVLITLVWLGIIDPYQNAMQNLDNKVASRQRQLEEIQQLRQDYLDLQQGLNEAQARLAKAENFSLFSFVEAQTGRFATKENLVYMRPQPTSTKDGWREDTVEIKLEKISLDQLVRFLYALETSDAVIQTKNLRIKTRFDNRSLLDVVMTVAAYGRAQ